MRTSLACLVVSVVAALHAGCSSPYPDSHAGRHCRHEIETCGHTVLYPTVQSCLDDYASNEAGRDAACLDAIHAFDACMNAAGTASCEARPADCEDEYTTLTPACGSFASPLGI